MNYIPDADEINCHITHLGTATMLIEVGRFRLLTDPVFDPAGGLYHFGYGTKSTKLTPPTIDPDKLGRIDAVLLSHDQHMDNLDRRGRALLPDAVRVITTRAGYHRLRGNSVGLRPFESTTIIAEDGLRMRIEAMPARHGPPGSTPLTGPVIGFGLQWDGQKHGALYISGDTVWHRRLEEIPRRMQISTAVFHLGAARFPQFGPIRFTMSAKCGAKLAKTLDCRTVVPIHCEGWTHFSQTDRGKIQAAFDKAGVGERVCWLDLGERRAFVI